MCFIRVFDQILVFVLYFLIIDVRFCTEENREGGTQLSGILDS